MATSHNTFEKRQRERNRAAKAAEKRAKRLERSSGQAREADEDAEPDPIAQLGSREFGHLDEAGLLEALATLHQRFDDGDVDFETFEKRKAAITTQLTAR